jgi:hypothetical protein
VSTTWSGRRHEHDHSVLTTFPVAIGGQVVSRASYRECACGDRVPDVVTEIPSPRIGDPYADCEISALPERT